MAIIFLLSEEKKNILVLYWPYTSSKLSFVQCLTGHASSVQLKVKYLLRSL